MPNWMLAELPNMEHQMVVGIPAQNLRKPAPVEIIAKIIRAPFFAASILFSIIIVIVIVSVVSIGDWAERLLLRAGYQNMPRWLPPVCGAVGYLVLGVGVPAWAGWWLLGWPGAIGGPVLSVAIISLLARWWSGR